MSKDIKWLKNEVNKLPQGFLRFNILKQREEFTVSKDDVLELINQLEEHYEMSEEKEVINHPTHYTQGSMETIEKIELLLTEEEYIGFLKGNIIKYDDRMNHKGDVENDLRKSKWYVERLRNSYYGGTNPLD